MVVIVRAFPVSVEALSKLATVPDVEELRPSWCPACGQPARCAAGRLGIVGHGTYERQVAGVVEDARDLLVWIRRYVCRGCRRTISVLPDVLYPRRWYAAATILLALVMATLRGVSAEEVRQRLGRSGETRGWKTLGRWRRQMFAPLWGWLGGQVGATDGKVEPVRGAWLRRLLALGGASARSPTGELVDVARGLLTGTAHDGKLGWQLQRDPRGSSTRTASR